MYKSEKLSVSLSRAFYRSLFFSRNATNKTILETTRRQIDNLYEVGSISYGTTY